MGIHKKIFRKGLIALASFLIGTAPMVAGKIPSKIDTKKEIEKVVDYEEKENVFLGINAGGSFEKGKVKKSLESLFLENLKAFEFLGKIKGFTLEAGYNHKSFSGTSKKGFGTEQDFFNDKIEEKLGGGKIIYERENPLSFKIDGSLEGGEISVIGNLGNLNKKYSFINLDSSGSVVLPFKKVDLNLEGLFDLEFILASYNEKDRTWNKNLSTQISFRQDVGPLIKLNSNHHLRTGINGGILKSFKGEEILAGQVGGILGIEGSHNDFFWSLIGGYEFTGFSGTKFSKEFEHLANGYFVLGSDEFSFALGGEASFKEIKRGSKKGDFYSFVPSFSIRYGAKPKEILGFLEKKINRSSKESLSSFEIVPHFSKRKNRPVAFAPFEFDLSAYIIGFGTGEGNEKQKERYEFRDGELLKIVSNDSCGLSSRLYVDFANLASRGLKKDLNLILALEGEVNAWHSDYTIYKASDNMKIKRDSRNVLNFYAGLDIGANFNSTKEESINSFIFRVYLEIEKDLSKPIKIEPGIGFSIKYSPGFK